MKRARAQCQFLGILRWSEATTCFGASEPESQCASHCGSDMLGFSEGSMREAAVDIRVRKFVGPGMSFHTMPAVLCRAPQTSNMNMETARAGSV
mmetsp:Transcript_75926/g.246395  ORF Transcript_75926/g.246395 Transcript_75926/m.246395 type:complete len:94 (-) Transcript_75926:175-456(-)